MICVCGLYCVFRHLDLSLELCRIPTRKTKQKMLTLRCVKSHAVACTVRCTVHANIPDAEARVLVQIEPAAMVAEATETAWRLLAPWLIQQWDNRQCAEDWSGLLGPHVEGPLRLSMCTLLRATQTALRGTADALLFDALPLAHGGTIGSVLEDLVVAEGVCGSVAYANTKRLDLAIETIVERGSRVNARSVQEALRTVPMVQVELHKQRIGIRVWNLLQVESLRVYSVETRCAAVCNCFFPVSMTILLEHRAWSQLLP